MKTVTMIISVLVLVILSSCDQKSDPTAILENPETRMELFEAIASNHSYMAEFMDNMQDNDHAMQMMQGNHKMMGNMMQSGGMQTMLKDSMMTKNMMQSMMKDGKMMGNICLLYTSDAADE